MRKYKHEIRNIISFANGMTAVFDQNNEQMPAFQGRTEEVEDKIINRLIRQGMRRKYAIVAVKGMELEGEEE